MSDELKTWLTPAAHQKLVEEYGHLTTDGRRVIEKRISEARQHGDLRENAEYDTAKNDQGFMEARIRELKYILDNSEVEKPQNSGAVEVGTIATVIDGDGDETEFFVAPAENNLAAGMLLASPDSPLRAALLGKRPGESVTYKAPGGTFTYELTAVRVYEG